MLTFTAPIWLWSLVPWALAAVLLLAGQLDVREVPFIAFWRGPAGHPKVHRAMHRPPVFVVVLIFGLLSIALATARPMWVVPAVTSPTPPPSVQIKQIVARIDPTRQIMLTLAGTGRAKVRIDHSPAGEFQIDGERNVFIDSPGLHDGSLVQLDDSPDVFEISVSQHQPRIEIMGKPAGNVPPAAAKMVQAYTSRRPGQARGDRVIVADSLGALLDSSGAVFSNQPASPQHAPWIFQQHPILKNVQFEDQLQCDSTAPAGFVPIVSSRGTTLIAVKDSPARQVWVGINDRSFESSPMYVILLTNIFDWLGEVKQVATAAKKPGPADANLTGQATTDWTRPLGFAAITFTLAGFALWPVRVKTGKS